MIITRKQLRKIIEEVVGRVMVPARLRGQNDKEAFSSGVFENEQPENEPDLNDDRLLPVAELTAMSSDIGDDVKI